jgi:hypothetical protein
MIRLLPMLCLWACGADAPVDPFAHRLEGAAQELEFALDASDPEPLIALLSGPRIAVEDGCPSVERIEDTAGIRETWTGGCVQADGTFIDGQLERFEGTTGDWISAEGFAVLRDDALLFYLDGAIEMAGEGGIWLIDATATTCGLEQDCAQGTMSVDLAFSIFPAAGFPHDYDVTVSGFIATDTTPILIDGAWRIDRAVCGIEPMDGTIAIQRGTHQTLRLDGAVACDACAEWALQGRPAPSYCATAL